MVSRYSAIAGSMLTSPTLGSGVAKGLAVGQSLSPGLVQLIYTDITSLPSLTVLSTVSNLFVLFPPTFSLSIFVNLASTLNPMVVSSSMINIYFILLLIECYR